MGRDYYPKAEEVLRNVVEGHVRDLRPESVHFKGASFLIGEVHYRMGDYNNALTRLATAGDMYPGDERVVVAGYYVADCHRRRALAAREKLKTVKRQEQREQILHRINTDFGQAAGTFRRVIDRLLVSPKARRDEVMEMYLRNAFFFEANCCYHLKQFKRAIQLYDDVIFRYRTRLEAITACRQVYNAYENLGQTEQGRIYVRRALTLLSKLPDAEFARFGGIHKREELRRALELILRPL
jgi:tetratricopeptide (TPR) repeat protein